MVNLFQNKLKKNEIIEHAEKNTTKTENTKLKLTELQQMEDYYLFIKKIELSYYEN